MLMPLLSSGELMALHLWSVQITHYQWLNKALACFLCHLMLLFCCISERHILQFCHFCVSPFNDFKDNKLNETCWVCNRMQNFHLQFGFLGGPNATPEIPFCTSNWCCSQQPKTNSRPKPDQFNMHNTLANHKDTS